MSSLVRSWSVGPGLPGRQVRKVERPRPLKMSLTLEDTVSLVETVIKQLEAASAVGGYDRLVRSSILTLSHNLKRLGLQVEAGDREKLERLQVAMRAACKDEQLDLVSRVHLLELIELRAMAWNPDQNVINYYKQKLVQIEAEVAAADSGSESPATAPVQLNPSAPDFRRCGPPSLGVATPTINGSTQMHRTPPPLQQRPRSPPLLQQPPRSPPPLQQSPRSPPLIQQSPRSPPLLQQPPPGRAKNNVPRNCGDAVEERRGQFRNGSVDPDNEFSLCVDSSAGSLTMTSTNIDLVRTAKRVLDQYFSLEGPVIIGEIPEDRPAPEESLQTEPRYKVHGGQTSPSPAGGEGEAKPDITYDRQELLHLAKSPLCKLPPPDWDKVLQGVPSVVKVRPGKMAGGPARQLIERAVDELARQEAAKAV